CSQSNLRRRRHDGRICARIEEFDRTAAPSLLVRDRDIVTSRPSIPWMVVRRIVSAETADVDPAFGLQHIAREIEIGGDATRRFLNRAQDMGPQGHATRLGAAEEVVW